MGMARCHQSSSLAKVALEIPALCRSMRPVESLAICGIICSLARNTALLEEAAQHSESAMQRRECSADAAGSGAHEVESKRGSKVNQAID